MTFKPIGSTALMHVDGNQSEAGNKRGEIGSEMTPQKSSEIVAWLAARSPLVVDKAAESRLLSHGVSSTIRYEGRYPSGPNGERLPSYDVVVGCDIQGDEENRKAALVDLEKFQEPAPVRQIEHWLAELSVLTAGRGSEGMDAELQVTAYASRLAQYPADVARYALLGKSWKWFPSWAELEQVCEHKAGPRRCMIDALRRPAPEPEPRRRPPTDEERARIQALIDEKFPNRSPEMRKAAVDEALRGNCMTNAAQ